MFKQKLVLVAVAAASTLSFPQLASATSPRGPFGDNNLRVIGLTADQRLISFNAAAPGLTTAKLGVVSGLVSDTSLVGIDYRVQDGKLYGVGNAGGVYTLDTKTGFATLVNRLTVLLDGTSFGVDFNPAADRLRIVSNSGQNLRHNVNVGGVTLVDAVLNNGATTPVTTTGVTAAAYTNNDLTPSTGTTLFDINTGLAAGLDALVLQAPPNAGVVANIGALGLLDSSSQPADVIGNAGFDIYSSYDDAGAAIANRGFATLTTPQQGTLVYVVDLTSGRATQLGAVRRGNEVMDIALPLDQNKPF